MAYRELPSGAEWTELGAGETGKIYETGGMRGAVGSVQVEGISGHTVTMQISNDGASFYTLKGYDGTTDIEFTADGILEFSTGARFLRPSVASGSGDVVVTLNFLN